jgi:hypothetical protein
MMGKYSMYTYNTCVMWFLNYGFLVEEQTQP